MPLARNVVTAVLVQLERHNGHPEFGRVIPYVTLHLSTTARSMHLYPGWAGLAVIPAALTNDRSGWAGMLHAAHGP